MWRSVYGTLRLLALSSAAIGGLSVAAGRMPLADTLLTAVSMAVQGVLFGCLVWGRAFIRRWVLVVGVGLLSGAATLALTGVVLAAGSGDLLIAVTLLAACLPLHRWHGSAPDQVAETLSDSIRAPAGCGVASVLSLSTVELCHAWQVSREMLQRAQDAEHRQAIVAVRSTCLDELERRDPAGFSRWLGDALTDAAPAFFISITASSVTARVWNWAAGRQA